MSRTRPASRLQDLIHAAATVFAQLGYARAQMADVARAMGVAQGTVYLYVEGKEALFDLVVRDALGLVDHSAPPDLPIPAPHPGATLDLVKPRLLATSLVPALAAALAVDRAKDVATEFADIVRDLFRLMTENRVGIVVLEKSAYEWPELAELFFETMRRRVLADLITYFDRRIAVGQVRPLPAPRVAALELLQTLTWFCLYRHSEMDWPDLDDATVCDSLADSLSHAFLTPRELPDSRTPPAH